MYYTLILKQQYIYKILSFKNCDLPLLKNLKQNATASDLQSPLRIIKKKIGM